MGLDRLEDLSTRERECLRLVSPTGSSNAIAATLNISRETGETLIKRARAKLGGVSRFVAADALREWESRPQSLGTDETGTENTAPICEPEQPPPFQVVDERTEAVNEREADYAPLPSLDTVVVAEQRNTLRALTRLLLLIAGAALMIVATLGMMAIAKEVQLWLSPDARAPHCCPSSQVSPA